MSGCDPTLLPSPTLLPGTVRGRRVSDTQCPGAAQPSHPALLRSQVQGGAGEYRIPSDQVGPNPPTQPYSAPRYREGQASIGYPVSGCDPTLLPSPTLLPGTERGRRVSDTQCPGAAQPSHPALLCSQVQRGAGKYRIPSVRVRPNPPTQPYSAPRYREGQASIGYPVSG